ncbi:MAG: hypothetical protein RL701_1804 [Pseudomonadota bacterium]
MPRRMKWRLWALVLIAASSCSRQAPLIPVPTAGATAAGVGTNAAGTTAAGGTVSSPTPVAGALALSGGAGSSGLGSAGTPADEDAGMPALGGAGAAGSPVKDDEPAYTGPKTAYPGRRWTVPEATHGALIQSNVEITMSDGVVLIGDVSYPATLSTTQRAPGKFPVLLTQNPYGAAFGAASGEIFVTHGYIFASIDVRGTSRSAGTHDMFAPREAEDGAALVNWAATLDGSDGRVGLHGCSQLGINQLETVSKLGPDSPVKAMIPACASGDFYRDTAFDNGIPTAVGAVLVGAVDASMNEDMFLYRDYWRIRDRLARAPEIAATHIPMLLWSGWHEPGALGSLELYAALQNLAAGRPADTKLTPDLKVSGRYQVIIGDWSHAGGLDQGIQLQWFDTWIKGVNTGLPKETDTPLHLAELGGTKRWLNANSYPLTTNYTPLYLASGGKLARVPDAAAGADTFTWVPPGQVSKYVDYATEPFPQGALLAGPMAAQLQAKSSNRNLQLVVELFDRAADGKLAQISRGSILGSLRRSDPTVSWVDDKGLPLRPRLTLDEYQPLTPDEPTRLDVPLGPSVWSIEPGHSIVVRISTQPRNEDCGGLLGIPVGCNPTTPMRDSLTGGVYTLQRGGELGSIINLPLLPHGALATAESAVSPTGRVDPSAQLLGAVEYPLPVNW